MLFRSVQQKLAQVDGVGDVELGGGSLPAVRVELLPFALNRFGVSSEDVRAPSPRPTPIGRGALSRTAPSACRFTPTTRASSPRTIGPW